MSESLGKRQISKRREEQRKAKLERRQARASEKVADEADQDALLERFRVLHEARASGEIDEESFRVEERRIRTALHMDADDED
jgi:hypothetical protein